VRTLLSLGRDDDEKDDEEEEDDRGRGMFRAEDENNDENI
jgi:hypothetical protein